jgi:hypothetical protein
MRLFVLVDKELRRIDHMAKSISIEMYSSEISRHHHDTVHDIMSLELCKDTLSCSCFSIIILSLDQWSIFIYYPISIRIMRCLFEIFVLKIGMQSVFDHLFSSWYLSSRDAIFWTSIDDRITYKIMWSRKRIFFERKEERLTGHTVLRV